MSELADLRARVRLVEADLVHQRRLEAVQRRSDALMQRQAIHALTASCNQLATTCTRLEQRVASLETWRIRVGAAVAAGALSGGAGAAGLPRLLHALF